MKHVNELIKIIDHMSICPNSVNAWRYCMYVLTHTNLVDFKYHYLHYDCIINFDILTLSLHRVDNNSLQAGMRFSSSSNLSLCFLS